MPVLKYTPSSYIRENLFTLCLTRLPTGVYFAGAGDGFFVSGFAVVVSAFVVCVDVAAVVTARIDAAQINNSAFFIGLSFLPLLSADVEEYRTVWTLW